MQSWTDEKRRRSAADFAKIVQGLGASPNKLFASVYTLALLAKYEKLRCGYTADLLAILPFPTVASAISQMEIGGNRRLGYKTAQAERRVKAAKRGEADALICLPVCAIHLAGFMIRWEAKRIESTLKEAR